MHLHFLLHCRICSNLEVPISADEFIKCDELYCKYEDHCKLQRTDPMTKAMFSKVLLQIYPSTKHSRIRTGEERTYVYKNLIWKSDIDNSPILNVNELENHLKDLDGVVLFTKTEFTAKIGVITDMISNGNQMFKEVNLNFLTKTWNLRVRGTFIDLKEYGIKNTFDCSVSNLYQIIHVVKHLKVCSGLEIEGKKKFPGHITVENISYSSSESDPKIRNKMFNLLVCITMVEYRRCLHKMYKIAQYFQK